MSIITAQISDELNNDLNKIAKITAQSKTLLIKKAIEKYIEEMQEDLKDAEIALQRMQNSNAKPYSYDEMRDFVQSNCIN